VRRSAALRTPTGPPLPARTANRATTPTWPRSPTPKDIDISGWPQGSRLLVRKEPLHPGAQQTIDDIDGYRFTAFLTDQTDDDLARLDTRHRGHARVEDRIRTGKDTGMRTLPCDTFDRNALWLQLVLLAQDLMTFTQILTLEDGELRSAEPQQLRYKLLHTPARIIRHARGIRLDLPAQLALGQCISSPRSTGSEPYPYPQADTSRLRSLTTTTPTSRRRRRRAPVLPSRGQTGSARSPMTVPEPHSRPPGPTTSPKTPLHGRR
jgi:hypothetical protein